MHGAGRAKNNNLIRQRRGDFTYHVNMSRYNQLETVLSDSVFSDTPVSTTTADELNVFVE